MWARLGRFLEIYGPNFETFNKRVTFNESPKRLSTKVTLSLKEF
jgi:hypothetical protein